MRRAVVVALGDPRSSDAGTWVDAVAWLRQELSALDYRVVVVDGEDVESELQGTLQETTPGDELFLHISGRLAERGVLRTAAGRWVRLQALGDALAACAAGRTSVFAELLHDDDPYDALGAAEHVSWVIDALGARARGYAMVAAVRPTTGPIEGLALTRLFLDMAQAEAEAFVPSPAQYERIAALPNRHAYAQSFEFVDGGQERRVTRPSPAFAAALAPAFGSARLSSFSSNPPPALEAETAADGTGDEGLDEAAGPEQWRRVVTLRLERLPVLEPARLRVRELVAVARILQVELDDAAGALELLEQAQAIDPHRVGVLQALRRGYERVGRWERAFAVIDTLADLAQTPAEGAELRYAQARIALDAWRDPDRAFGLLQAALRRSPGHQRALAAFDEVHALRAHAEANRPGPGEAATPADTTVVTLGPPDPLESARSRAAGRGAAASESSVDESDAAAAANIVGRGDAPARSRERASVAAPPARAPAVLHAAIDPAFHAKAFDTCWREGRTDAAFLAAMALEELGAAGPDSRRLVDRVRAVTPIRARGTLDAAAWDLLRAPGSDGALAALFAAAARAALTTRIEQLVARKRLVALDPAKRLDHTSTASVVRSFQWAARVLGVAGPALYVLDEVPGEIAAVRAVEPSTALGHSVVRGRTAKDLAFLAARHLTYYRPEHQVLVYFPTEEDLARLFMALVALGSSSAPPDGADRSVAALRARLETNVTPGERAALGEAVRRLSKACDLGAWARSAELTAARAGLLLCGDLATASAVMGSEARAIAGLSSVDKREDLVSFCTSEAHARLRERFVVTASENAQAPATTVNLYSP